MFDSPIKWSGTMPDLSNLDSDYILMCKNTEVAKTLTDPTAWAVINPRLMPRNFRPEHSETELTPTQLFRNKDKFLTWCSGRVLPIDRVNAKKILNCLGLTQSQTNEHKAAIALSYRCLSVCDSYWIRFGDADIVNWEEVNLFTNSLNKAIALVALKGTSLSVQAKHGLTAEVSTIGSYPKGWFRMENDKLFLYKTYGTENDEPEREVCASKVIDCFNIYGNVKYDIKKLEGVTCSRCEIMTTPDRAMVAAADMNVWCIAQGTNVVDYARANFGKQFAQMLVIDYLIANSDRHAYNWGFFQSMDTGQILGLHDLYDHNNAFDKDLLEDENYRSIVLDSDTMKQAAHRYLKASQLSLTMKVSKKWFPTAKAYLIFKKRCEELQL
jgi:hypothetical protein